MCTNIQVTRSPSDSADQFSLNITGAESAEAAQKDLSEFGSDEELVAFIALNPEDLGVQAVATVLQLAVEAGDAGHEIGAESLLLAIFMAGRNSVAQQE